MVTIPRVFGTIKNAYRLAGVKYPKREIKDGIRNPLVLKRSRNFERRIIKLLSKLGKVYPKIKTSKGSLDCLFEFDNKKCGLKSDNPYQIHKSKWSVEDFKKLGFKVYGLRGLKYLRGEYATVKYKPWIFWAAITFVSEFFFYFSPKFSYHIFAIKDLKR